MVSSSRQMFVRLLLLLTAIASANAQSAVDKASSSSISGKVTIGGKGVSGMVVALAIATPSNSTYVTQLKAVTDEEGNYRIKNLPPNTYQVLVSASQYVQSERRITVVVGKNEVAENINVTLIRGGVITGKVTDADGRALVEEPILFSSITASNAAFPFWRTIRTDDRGIYRAFGLPPGRYTVSAGKDSMASYGRAENGYQRTYHPGTVHATEATAIEVTEGSEATNVDIVLGRKFAKYVARGRIIDGETSQPLPNAGIGIKFFFANGNTSSGISAVSTKEGEFKIENLTPGKYAVYSQTDPDRVSEAVRFEVIDQDVEGLVVKTFKGASVSGVVVLEGVRDPTLATSLTGYVIVAFVSNEFFGRSEIKADGSFSLPGLPAGRVTLQFQQTRNHLKIIRIERDGVASTRGFEIREREQIRGLRVVVGQANGKIRGVLKFPEGWQLPATARLFVYLKRIDDPTAFVSPVIADARRQFLVEELVAGTYELKVIVDGVPAEQRPTMAQSTPAVVVTNGAIADVTITLQRPKTGP